MILDKITQAAAIAGVIAGVAGGAYGWYQSARADKIEAKYGQVVAEYAALTKLQEKSRKLAEEGASLAIAQQKVIDEKTLELINANSRVERERIDGLQRRAKDRAAAETQIAGLARAIQEAASFESLAVAAEFALRRCGSVAVNGATLLGEAARAAEENAAIAISAQADAATCRSAVDNLAK